MYGLQYDGGLLLPTTVTLIESCQTLAKEKPRYIVGSLEEFLIPGALEAINEKIDAEKATCASLAQRGKAPKAKPGKKGESLESQRAKLAQAQSDAKQAKEELACLSQKLVLSLVKMIEQDQLLKPAMSLHPTSANDKDPENQSRSMGMPDVAASHNWFC